MIQSNFTRRQKTLLKVTLLNFACKVLNHRLMYTPDLVIVRAVRVRDYSPIFLFM